VRKTLGLTILGLLLAAVPVLAQGVVSVGNLVAQPGASVDVPVYVTGVPQVGGAAVTIQVAAPAGAPGLQVGDAVKGSVFADPQDAIATDRATPGEVKVVALSVRGGAGPGTLFTIPVTVAADAPRGTIYVLRITKIEVVDAASNPVQVSTAEGGISVAMLGAGVLSVQSTTGAPGQTVNLQVLVSEGVVGLGGASVTLLAPGLVIAGDAVKGTLFTGPSDVIQTNRPASDVAQVVVLTPGTTNGPGSLFSLPVTIPATAKPGQVFPVIIRAAELVDGANNPIAVAKEDGSVTVRVAVAATISVGVTSARPGEVAMIRVTAGPDVRALGALKAVLDLGVMTAAGDATLAGSLFTGPNDQISTDRSNPNRPQVIVVSPGAVDGPGTLFSIPVQVPADAKPGTILPIQLVQVEAVDKDNQPIQVIAQHGGVLVLGVDMFIRVDPRDVLPGETFALSVSIGAGVTNLGGVRAVLNLGGLQAVGEATIKGTLFENITPTLIGTNLADPGRPHVVLVSAGAVSGPGTVFLIPVKVPDNAVPGQEYLVQLEGLEAIDSNNQVMPLLIGPDSGRIRVRAKELGTVSVVSVTGVNAGDVVNLHIAADDRVIGLAGARFALDLGGMTAAGDATLEGGIFAGIPNTQIQTDRSVPGAPQVIIVSPGAASGPGVVFTIPVKVPDAALPGTQFLVRLSVVEAIDAANNPLALLTRDGTVTVGGAPPPIPGLVVIRDASGAPGSTISLNVDIENVTGVGGARVNLNLGGLTAVGEATSTLFAGPNDIVRTDLTNPGAPQVILLTPNTKDAPATLFTIPVQIPATATEGQTFTVTATVEFIDAANNPILMNVQPGKVTVVGVPAVGVVKVRDMEADPDSVATLVIEADANVKALGALKMRLDLGPLSAAGKATLAGGLFEGIANTQTDTDLSDASRPQVIVVSPGAVSGPGVLYSLPIRVPADQAGKEITVTVPESEFIDAANQAMKVEVRSGVVKVRPAVPPPVKVAEIEVGSLEGAPGATVRVPVNIGANTKELGAARVVLDVGRLQASAAEKGALLAADDQISTNVVGSQADVIVVIARVAAGPGELFALPVKIPEDAKDGEVFPIKVVRAEAIDANNQPITDVRTKDGAVTARVVAPPPAGVVKVRDMEADPDSVATLVIEADANVKALGALKMRLDLGPLSAAGKATLAGGLFEGIANTQTDTDLSDASRPQVIVVSPGAVSGPGVLYSLPIRVPADQAGKEITVTVPESEFIDAANQAMKVEVRSGVVKVRPAVPPPVKVAEIEVGSLEGAPGATVRVPVNIGANTKELGAARVVLDVGRLQASAAEKGALLAADDQISTNVVGSQADVIVVIARVAAGPGELFALPVKIPEDAKDGEVFPIKVVRAEAIDANNQPITDVRTKDGQVTARVVPPPPVTANVISASTVKVKPGPDPSGPVVIRVDNAASLAAVDLTVTYKASLGKFDAASAKVAGVAVDPNTVIRAEDTEVAGNPELRQLRVVLLHPRTIPDGASGAIATVDFIGAADLKPLDSSLITPVRVTMADARNVETDITARARPGGLIAAAEWVIDLREIVGLTGAVSSSVSALGNTVYFGDSQGRVYSVNASTGAWAFSQPVDLGAGAGRIVGRPTVKEDAVYVVTSGGRVAKIAAVGTPGAGTVLWNVPALADGPAPNATASVQTDATGKLFVYVPDAAGRVHKLDAATGVEVAVSADLTPGAEMLTSPSVGLLGLEAPFNFDLWVGAGRNIYRLNADDLTTRGTEFPITVSDELISPPFVTPLLSPTGADRGVVFASKDGKVYVLSATTGRFIGNSPYDAKAAVTGATFVTVDANGLPTTVFVPAQDGSVHAVDLNTVQGAPLATGLQGTLDQALIVAAKSATDTNFVYVPAYVDNNTLIHIVSTGDPTKRYSVVVPGKPSAPALSRARAAGEVNVVVVTTDTGAVVALPQQ